MAQRKGKAGARLDLQLRAVPEAAEAAANLVLLYKPLPYRPGYCYAPFAVVQVQDLPEQLRRQIAGGGGQGTAAGPGGFYDAQAPAGPHRDEGAQRHHLLQVLRAARPVAGVPEDLSRQLPGVASRPNDDPAVMFAGAFETEEGSMRAWLEQFGGGAPSIRRGADAEMVRAFGDNGLSAPLLHKKNPADGEMGALYRDGVPAPENAERVVALLLHGKNPAYGDRVPAGENVERVAALLLHEKNPADGEVGAFDGNGVPARENAALLLLKNKATGGEMGGFYITGLPATEYPDGLVVFPGDDDADAVPLLLGGNRSAEQGSVYHYDSGVLVPPPDNIIPAYAVQVSVDAAAGAKAGDPIAVDVKIVAGEEEEEEAGNERGSLSAVAGIVAASSAATALSAGAVGPVMAFGLFGVLVGGLSLAMASVRAA